MWGDTLPSSKTIGGGGGGGGARAGVVVKTLPLQSLQLTCIAELAQKSFFFLFSF